MFAFRSHQRLISSSRLRVFSTSVGQWEDEAKSRLRKSLQRFSRRTEAKLLAMNEGIFEDQFPKLAREFSKQLVRQPDEFFNTLEDQKKFMEELSTESREMYTLHDLLLDYARKEKYLDTDNSFQGLSVLDLTDLRHPHKAYPTARAMKRKIVYHAGPTNSGKTYEALERLKQADEDGGIYCGPLRLLALEIYEKLNIDGISCSLSTGQELREIPGSDHVACTIEMCNTSKVWDVAVLDEIQMIKDTERGWAWTRALFALPAREVHVCGSDNVVDLVRKQAELMGDEFELKTYERRTPLTISKKSLQSYKNVKKGDCIVAFSRKKIFEIKHEIESNTSLKCCVVYGSLPPETRSHQARLFNKRDSGYDVLVASDAVGMGLNLNIQRVILDGVRKFNGSDTVYLEAPLIKQIAGRAGRSGSDFPEGFASCLRQEDMEFLREAMQEKDIVSTSFGLFPSVEQMEEFASRLPHITDLSELLDKFVELARTDGNYFVCNHEEMKKTLALISDIPLPLNDRFTLAMAPVSHRSEFGSKTFVNFVRAHHEHQQVALNVHVPSTIPASSLKLRNVEEKIHAIDLYLWLARRYEHIYIDSERAEALKAKALRTVNQALANLSRSSKKPRRERRKSFAARL